VRDGPPKRPYLLPTDSCKGSFVSQATFDDAPESGHALVIRIPTQILRHEIPFEFRDVEMP